MRRALLRIGLLLGFACACGDERWVIGDPRVSAADAGTESAEAAARCVRELVLGIPEPLPAPLFGAGHAGRWLGVIDGEEASKFPATQLLLTLGTERAALRIEAGGVLPPLEPAAGYLCHTPGAATCASESGLVGDFEYTLESRARGSVLSLRLFLEQPWDGWCRAQPPVETVTPGCEPSYDVEHVYEATSWEESCAVLRGDQWFGIDCDRLATVERHPCACDRNACRAGARTQELNLRLVAPDALEGALWFAPDRAQVVRFTRQASGAP